MLLQIYQADPGVGVRVAQRGSQPETLSQSTDRLVPNLLVLDRLAADRLPLDHWAADRLAQIERQGSHR